MPVITPITPLEAGGEMFQRARTPSMFDAKLQHQRPASLVSETTEILDTDIDDESEFEPISPKDSLESVSAVDVQSHSSMLILR